MLMTIQFPIHPFWNFYCQNLGGKVSTNMQLNAPFLKMNFLPKIVIIFKSKSSLKCESTMKWSVKSYSLWNAGLQFFTEQTCGQRCEGILKVLCSGEGGRVAHTLMRGSLLSSQPVTFLVETNPGLATLSHYTMSAILSRVWPSHHHTDAEQMTSITKCIYHGTKLDVILWSYWGCQPTPHPAVWPGKHLLHWRCR